MRLNKNYRSPASIYPYAIIGSFLIIGLCILFNILHWLILFVITIICKDIINIFSQNTNSGLQTHSMKNIIDGE